MSFKDDHSIHFSFYLIQLKVISYFQTSPSKIPFSNCFYPKTKKDSFNDDYLSTDGWEQNKFTVDEALLFSLIVAEEADFLERVF